jgi:hypothetical protein
VTTFLRTLPLAVLIGAIAQGSAAQDVYKYVDRDGRVVYTDDPKAGGGKAQRVEDATSVVPVPAPVVGAGTRAYVRQTDDRLAELDRAVDDIAAASLALREAEARRVAGIEPLEGERQGRRYRNEYWQRQEALQQQVDAARLRLEDANARRNAFR